MNNLATFIYPPLRVVQRATGMRPSQRVATALDGRAAHDVDKLTMNILIEWLECFEK